MQEQGSKSKLRNPSLVQGAKDIILMNMVSNVLACQAVSPCYSGEQHLWVGTLACFSLLQHQHDITMASVSPSGWTHPCENTVASL